MEAKPVSGHLGAASASSTPREFPKFDTSETDDEVDDIKDVDDDDVTDNRSDDDDDDSSNLGGGDGNMANQQVAPATNEQKVAHEEAVLNDIVAEVPEQAAEPKERANLKTEIDGQTSDQRTPKADTAVEQTIEEASMDLKKSKVKVVETNKEMSVQTKSGEVIKTTLDIGEKSRVVEGEDGSSVLIIDQNASSKEKFEAAANFVADKVENRASERGIKVLRGFRRRLLQRISKKFGQLIRFFVIRPTVLELQISAYSDDTPQHLIDAIIARTIRDNKRNSEL